VGAQRRRRRCGVWRERGTPAAACVAQPRPRKARTSRARRPSR
jgi:hypothetical protein